MPIFNSALAGGAAASSVSTSNEVKLITKTAKANKAVLRHQYSASSASTYTVSMWFKRGKIDEEQYLFGSNGGGFGFNADNKFIFCNSAGTVATFPAQCLDTAAWSHIVVSVTSGSFKAYLNGQLFAQNVFLSNSPPLGGSGQHVVIFGKSDTTKEFAGKIGRVECVLAERTPSDFGFYGTYNVWQPKEFTGGYGNLGFKLEFTSASIGADTSGQSNNFSVVNTNTGNSQNTVRTTVDSPTDDTVTTDNCNGGEIAGNYPVFQVLDRNQDTIYGPLGDVVMSINSSTRTHYTTISIDENCYYAEFLCAVGSHFEIGVSAVREDLRSISVANGYGASYKHNGVITYATQTSLQQTVNTNVTFVEGDTIGILFDLENDVLQFYKITNSGSQLVRTIDDHLEFKRYKWVFAVTTKNSSVKANFGETAFRSNVGANSDKDPKCLCSTNLDDTPIIEGRTRVNCFNYTGNGNDGHVIGGLKFRPSLLWLKKDADGVKHFLFDRIRGAKKRMGFGSISQETSNSSLKSFDSNGFTLDNNNKVNDDGKVYTAWAWGAPDSEVTVNQDGDYHEIFNDDAGFTMLSDKLDGTPIDVPHSLDEEPLFFIYKLYNKEKQWFCYHESAGEDKALGFAHKGISDTTGNNNNVWQSKEPDENNIYVGDHSAVNANNKNFIIYAWREVPGFSRFGRFLATSGAPNEQFVYCGFRPSVVMIRPTDVESHWYLMYARENGRHNILTKYYNFENSDAEQTETDGLVIFTASGFRMKEELPESQYYYMAWGDWPTKYARAY